MLMFTGAPILVAMAAFGTFSWQGHDLTADVAFPALAYFDLLRFPLIMLPWQIIEFVSAGVALGRLQRFVDAEETDALTDWEAKALAESTLPVSMFFLSYSSVLLPPPPHSPLSPPPHPHVLLPSIVFPPPSYPRSLPLFGCGRQQLFNYSA